MHDFIQAGVLNSLPNDALRPYSIGKFTSRCARVLNMSQLSKLTISEDIKFLMDKCIYPGSDRHSERRKKRYGYSLLSWVTHSQSLYTPSRSSHKPSLEL